MYRVVVFLVLVYLNSCRNLGGGGNIRMKKTFFYKLAKSNPKVKGQTNQYLRMFKKGGMQKIDTTNHHDKRNKQVVLQHQ